MCAPFLSRPAARPTGLGKVRPNARVGSGAGRRPSSGLSPLRYAASIAASVAPCAVSASSPNRKGRTMEYMSGSGGWRSEVELDALCQRQRVGVVDGIRLPAHVGAPCIRTRLATAAGFLLATERTANLGAAGADIDVGDAAVRARCRQERLGRLQVLGEDRRRQALR